MATPNTSPSGLPTASQPASGGGGGLFMALLTVLALGLALLGAWIGSTLLVSHGGPGWVGVACAVAVFFLIPLLWELLADPEQRGGRLRDAILRSSVLSGLLIVVLLATHPERAFEALATRGDWFLGDAKGSTADAVRRGLFTLADGLEWLNDWVREKPYADIDDSADIGAPDVPPPVAPAAAQAAAAPAAARSGPNEPGAEPDGGPDDAHPPEAPARPAVPGPSGRSSGAAPGSSGLPIAGTDLTWPLPEEPLPAVAAMPEAARKSLNSVALWLKSEFPDPVMRARALHDFVAGHVAYDEPRRLAGRVTSESQAPGQVFATGLAVCAGYANLTAHLGRAAGLEVARLSGDARLPGDYARASRESLRLDARLAHAWNAVKLNGHWHFLDTTWDAGYSVGKEFRRVYSTAYLFTPPEAMILHHRPHADSWQRLPAPLSRAEWLRQPLLEPKALAFGLAPADFDRPIIARNPPTFGFTYPPERALTLLSHIEGRDAGGTTVTRTPCEVKTPEPGRATIACPPVDERVRIVVFAGKTGDPRTPAHVAEIYAE